MGERRGEGERGWRGNDKRNSVLHLANTSTWSQDSQPYLSPEPQWLRGCAACAVALLSTCSHTRVWTEVTVDDGKRDGGCV